MTGWRLACYAWLLGCLCVPVACGSSDSELQPELPRGLERFDSYEYYDLLGGDLSLGLDGVEPSALDSDEEWTALVSQQRASGLAGLQPPQRRDLLMGATKAYLTLVESANFEYQTTSGDAVANESYVEGEGNLRTHLDLRQASYDGVEVEFGGLVLDVDSDIEEARALSTSVAGVQLPPEVWVFDSVWTCGQGGDFYDLARSIRLTRLGDLWDAHPREQTAVNGHSFEVLTVSRPDLPDSVYWLDAETLWLVAWSEPAGLIDGSYTELKAQVKSVNEPVVVERPADSCEGARAPG